MDGPQTIVSAAPGTGAGTALRVKLAEVAPTLRTASRRMWLSGPLSELYPAYLKTMHCIVRASVPLMELAAERCSDLGSSDAVASTLRQYLSRHIAEERGHSAWLLADLAVLGHDQTWRLHQPPPVVARLVGPAYYWVLHHHPLSLLGYVAALEFNAPSASLASWIETHGGIPPEALGTIREHARLDGGHSMAVFDLLDSMPLTEAQSAAVSVTGLCAADGLVDLYGYLARSQDERPGARMSTLTEAGRGATPLYPR
jgi:hypothetical protein